MAGTRKKCQYWDKCFRKAATHRKQFIHPGDEDEDTVTGDAAKVNEIKTKTKKAPEKTVDTGSDTGSDSEEECIPKKLVKMGGPVKVAASGDAKKTDDADNADDSDTNAMDTTPPKPSKLRKRKTHEMSQSDGEDDEPVASTSKKMKKAPEVKKVRLRCKYWGKCFQKGQAHIKEYIHPGDHDAPDEEDEEVMRTRGKTNAPLHDMADGETVDVGGQKIHKSSKSYSCTCPAWVKHKNAPEARTCKHLTEYLGEEHEKQRTGSDKPKKNARIPQHINVSVLLAQKYDKSAVDPVGWWMSEKLDGVRAFWNGRCFYSRLGNAFYAPEWFTKDLPSDMQLDGELFGGRKKFQSTVSIVKTPSDNRWRTIKYHVFDVPSLESQPFESRYEELQTYFNKANPAYAVLCEQTKCTGKKHIEVDLKKVLGLGGEGLMIRQPKSKYERTRSSTLLKIKKFHDAEAVVIGHEKGKGRNQFVCGALRCRMECGKEFSVGSGLNDADRKKPPKIGSIITYRFQEYTNSGSPRFPTFVGIRIDADGPKDAVLPKIKTDD